MVDLRVELCGVELANPLIVSSGPLTFGAAGIRRCFAAGAAAAVTKTIRAQAAVNPVPHIAELGRGTMLNTEKWSDLSVEQWTACEFPALDSAAGVVIASVGHTEAEVEEVLPQLKGLSTIRMIELVSYVAHDMVPMVAAAKRLSTLPVLAKMSPNWPDVNAVVAACLQAGVDGITAADSVGPTLHIDIETARPVVESDYGYAWMSGTAIRPLIARIVADICRRYPDLPVVATGGISDYRDVIEMLMLGAVATGVHTAPMLRGIGWFDKTADGLKRWLVDHGERSAADVQGRALPALTPGEDTGPLEFVFDPHLCNECNRCVTVCAYEARQLESKQMVLAGSVCRRCGLCVSVCPTGALSVSKVR